MDIYLQVEVNIGHVGTICEGLQEHRLGLFILSPRTKDTSQVTQSCKYKQKERERRLKLNTFYQQFIFHSNLIGTELENSTKLQLINTSRYGHTIH